MKYSMHCSAAVLAVGLLILSLGSSSAHAQTMLALAPGDRAPVTEGTFYPSQEVGQIDWSASEYTLVNFWAIWCEPCIDEMPALQKMNDAYASRGFRVVGVLDQQITPQTLISFLERIEVRYPILHAGPHVDLSWRGIGAMPTSFLVNRSGKVLRRYVGTSPEQVAGLRADIEAVLTGRPLPPIVMPRPMDASATHLRPTDSMTDRIEKQKEANK